jgi:hypothetical protein
MNDEQIECLKEVVKARAAVRKAQHRLDLIEGGFDPDKPIKYLVLSTQELWDKIKYLTRGLEPESSMCGLVSLVKDKLVFGENVVVIVVEDTSTVQIGL